MNVESVIGRLRRKYFASAAPRRRGAPNRLKVESLEAREVPATLPAPVIDYTTTRNIDVATNIQDFAPTIAQDPLNPNNLFGAMVEKSGASSTMTMIYSNNGGVTWVSSARYANGFDPEASTPGGLVRFTNVSNPSVTFDRFDNAYLTYTEHTLNNSSGRLVLRKYNFAGTPLELDIGDKNPADNANNAGTTNGTPGHTLYQWLGTDPAYNPTVAVDFNEAVTLPDPDTGESQTDQIAATQPTADQVKVFVAWNSDDVTPENTGANFISNIIRMTASNDGGVNFAPSVIVNNNNHFSASGTAYTQPKIVFTPGRDGQGTSGGQMVTLFSNADATGSSGPNSPGLISDVSTFDTTTAPISFEAINSQGVGIPSGGADATSPTGFQFVDYPITVPAGSGISTLEELSVRLAIQQDSSLSEMQIDLISPDGTRRVRLLKFYDPSNPPAGGIAGGSLLGLSDINGGDRVFAAGTVFTDNAAREIQDRTAASPFIGEFRPDTGTLSGPTGTFTGMTPAEFEGQWIVRISDNTGTTFSFGSRIQEAALRLSQNFRDNLGPDTQTGIFGITPNSPTGTNHPNAGTAAAAASPAGFGTGLSLAVDNTQGSFSPYQNRVYAAYEKGGSVLVSFSDDNGKLWTVSPATIGPGFNPQIAVDPATGTVLVSYYSANDDPALTLNGTLPGTRSVTMLATSVNGPAFTSNGSTPQGRIEFSKPAPVNPQDTTYDQIRSKTIKTEYVSSNGPGMGAETYGNNMGLVSYSGNVSLLYGGNLDRAFSQVRTQRLHIAAGPRIAGADTGAILTESTLADKFAGGTITYNGPAATGQAQFTGFYVEFDRVISQVSPKVFAGVAAPSPFDTFNPEDIKIIYRAPGSDPTGNGVQITPLFVQRIDDFVDPVPTGGGHVAQDYGSKRFFVAVAPRDQAGTYSYVVGPMAGYEGGRFGNTDSNANPILGSNVIRDRIRNTTFALGTPTGTVLYNSTDDAPPPPFGTGPTPLTIVDALGGSSGGVTSDILVPPAAPGEVINRVTVKVNITHERTSDLALFLRSPSGQTVRLMLADDSTDTLVATGAPPNDTLANLTDTVFADDDPNTTADDNNTTIAGDDVFGPPYTHTYLPVDPLGIYFGSRIDGTWTLTVIDSKAGSQGTLDQWDLTIEKTAPVQTIVRGNFFDQDNDGKQAEPVEDLFSVPTAVDNHPFVLPYAPEAKPITVTGPRVVGSRPVTQDQTDDNLVLNSTTASLDVAFDRTINATTFTPADVLRFIGPSGDLPVGAVTVTPVTALNGAALAANTNSRFFRIGFASQKLPGTYQIQLSADIADTNGTKMDPDTNAGVNVLVGSSSDTATTDIAYGGVFGSAPGVPNANVAVAGNSIATITLNVGGAGYLVNKALANVSVSVPSGGNLRDLEARLVSPDGSRSVLLFNNAPTTGVNTVATNVTFTDQSITDTGASVSPVQNGFATNGFNNPITPLAQVNGTRATGAWKLVIHNKGTATATVSKFALTLTKPVLGSGVGDAIADQTSVAFRVFQADGAVDTAKGNLNTSGPDGNTPTPFETTTNGRVSQLQSDPADPSGNTVYAAGASGGLWRTANFLTRDSVGPTWVPLTDFGPNEVVRDPITGAITRYGAAINIGTFSLFNETGDPQNTKIMIGTGSSALNVIDGGEDNNRYDGVGFLYSEDAGKTWNVLDSKVNYGTPTGGTGLKYLPVADAQRDHMFVGTVINKIVYEKKIVANGNLPIIYAAVGQGSTPAAENMAGLWRSVDGGRSWQQIKDVARGNDLLGKEVTDFAIGEGSALGNTFNRPTIGYVAVQGVGIYQTGNLSAASVNSITFDLMAGGAGRPTVNTGSLTVPAPFTPNGAKGRIQLVTPRYLFGDALANNYYKQWLVAAVSAPGGKLDGVFVTKDQGQNWTRLNLNANGGFADTGADIELTRPLSEDDYFSDRGTAHSIALAMDPTDPNILYVGADRLIRVDMTLINDPFKLQEYSHRDATGGVYTTTTNANNDPSNAGGGLIGPDALDTSRGAPALNSVTPINDAYDADLRATRRRVWNFTNLKFNPYEPFLSNTTIFTSNITTFENNGNDVLWVDPAVRRINASATNTTPEFSNDFDWVSSIITTVDPLTGRARVLWGHDEGVGTFVATEDGSLDRVDGFDQRDVNLTLGPTVATDTARETNLQIEGSRNGNMTVARLYSGDAQPSLLAASVSQSLLLGAARRAGDTYQSGESILADGETSWGDDGRGGRANWVQADQTGTGDVYILRRINDLFRNGDPTTDFFQVQKQGGVPISRTNGLYTGDGTPGSVTRDAQGLGQWTNFVRRFNVNPIDPNGLLMGSNNGRLYGTLDQGKNWFIAADKATAIPGSVTDLDGTYVKAPAFGAPVLTIPGDPPAGLSEYLYAGTEGGNIFVRTGNDLAPVWKKITTALDLSTLDGGPILKLQPSPTRGSNALYAVTEAHVYYMADWTSADPLVNSWKDVTGNLFTLTHKAFTGAYGLNGDFETTLVRRLSSIVVDWRPFTAPTPGLPVLYAAGDAGVFRSLDNGTTWTRFTGTATGAAADGGGLPVAKVSDIDLVLGNITPATGRANSAGSPDALVVTTVGRGMWTLALGKPAGISGPKVVPEKVSPLTPVGVPFSSATVEFDGYINAASFTPADVTVTGPNGPVAVTGVTDITVPDPVTQINLHNRYRIDFVPQNTDGTYTITVGPNITDAGGTKMNQDGDGINGEPVTPTSIGDAFRFNVVVGSTDISDFIHDSYTELLGRSETSAEVILKAPALEKARLTALGVVVKELLIGYDPVTKAYPVGADTARRQLLYRLYNKGGPSTTEVGGFLPTGPTSPASANDPLIDALIADLRANRKTPETITIDILSETNYYTKAGTTTDPVIDPNPATAPSAVFLNNLYKDLFPNLTIDPYTDLTAVTYGNQKTQAGTSTGRKALVTALVNGGPNTVVYDDDGVGVGSTAVKRTDYRTNFVNLAYQQVLGRLPDASVTAAGKADRAFAAAVRAAIAGRAVNGTSGTENVYARLLATKEFFTLQRQAEPLGSDETADAGSHTDRSWVEGVIKKRYFGTPVTFTNSTPPPATISLYSTDLQRDTFSGKILNNATFLTARLNFVRALTLSAEYRTIQVQKYYNQVLGRAAAEAEVKAKVNYASIPSLIAGLLGSADYAIKSGSVVSPALAAVPASRKWAAAVYQTLFGVAPTTASRDYLAAYARAYGRAAAAGRVLSAVDGTTLATASKFTPAGGLHQTYREKILIPQTFTNVLGRLPTPAEVTKYLAFLKLNRWEYFTADLTLGREFYEVVG